MIQYLQTAIPDVWEIIPHVLGDERGSFTEVLRFDEFYATLSCQEFVQENESVSRRGVLRGMHLQTGETAQAKLVRCTQGQVLDVAIDLRLGSGTFGQHIAVLLDSQQKNQLFVPRGFAHGFLVLSEMATFSYKVDNFYSPSTEYGLSPFDPSLAINWEQLAEKAIGESIFSGRDTVFSHTNLLLSEKDLNGHSLADYCQMIL